MLEFAQTDISINLIVTLSELTTKPAPDYLFEFRHVLTKDVVSFIKNDADDESNYPDRYNKFNINPSVLFAGQQPGEWHYRIYENDLNGVVLEYGKMLLERAAAFAFTKYESSNSFKTYNG